MYLRSVIDNVVVSCATQDVKVSSVLSKVKAEIFIRSIRTYTATYFIYNYVKEIIHELLAHRVYITVQYIIHSLLIIQDLQK